VPARDAAVPRLIAALHRVQNQEAPVRVIPAVAAMFAALAPLAPEEDRAGFANLASSLELDSAFRARFLSNLQYSALVRNTVTTTMLAGSSRTNVVPAVATAQLDARLLPGESCVHFSDQLRTVLADPGIAIERILHFSSQSSSADTPLFRAIGRVAARTDRRSVVVPRVIAGFTDAHYFRTQGITAYGFVPRWHNVDELRGVHGPDERLSVENLEHGVATLIAILKELDRVEASEIDDRNSNRGEGVDLYSLRAPEPVDP
jgi:carboxypeptidase PM20D1